VCEGEARDRKTGNVVMEPEPPFRVVEAVIGNYLEDVMGFGRGILLWLLGIPLPIILLLAIFWHH
jgi:hypothetical protein